MCVILKQQDGLDRLIGHRSRNLSDNEKNLATARNKSPEIMSTVLLRPFLEESLFIVQTYLEALKMIMTMSHAPGKLAFLRILLLKIEIDIIHCTCVRHQGVYEPSK